MVPTLGTRSSNLWESGVPCNGNLWFQGSQPIVPISGNRQFLVMVTCGFEVRSKEFQRLGIEVPCNGNLWFPAWELAVSNLRTGPDEYQRSSCLLFSPSKVVFVFPNLAVMCAHKSQDCIGVSVLSFQYLVELLTITHVRKTASARQGTRDIRDLL